MSNLMMLHTVAKGLDYLLPSVVFVGGSVTDIRPTNDVDLVVELVTYSAARIKNSININLLDLCIH